VHFPKHTQNTLTIVDKNNAPDSRSVSGGRSSMFSSGKVRFMVEVTQAPQLKETISLNFSIVIISRSIIITIIVIIVIIIIITTYLRLI
jgi:hypothetical protein